MRPTIRRFDTALEACGFLPLQRVALSELQINIGKLCNQACHHCHVDAGPKRTEVMSWETMKCILAWVRDNSITAVDITGGAPEMNPNFRGFVQGLLDLGVSITARCNLSILLEPGQEDLAQWYTNRQIRLVCSLPCYTQVNVDNQRGKGVFNKSITALQQLNKLGYGKSNGLTLDLVYNPGGAFLPPDQQSLEQDYRTHLQEDFDIEFTNLLALTNLPISRFLHTLVRDNQLNNYMNLLNDNFNSGTVPGLMCRYLMNVDWQGRVYDCDFNQMLDLPIADEPHKYLWDIKSRELTNKTIATGQHCFGCTAGAGSSCGGSLV